MWQFWQIPALPRRELIVPRTKCSIQKVLFSCCRSPLFPVDSPPVRLWLQHARNAATFIPGVVFFWGGLFPLSKCVTHVTQTHINSCYEEFGQLQSPHLIVLISKSPCCPLSISFWSTQSVALCLFSPTHTHTHTHAHTHTHTHTHAHTHTQTHEHHVPPHVRWWNSWRSQEISFWWNRSGLRDNWALVGEEESPLALQSAFLCDSPCACVCLCVSVCVQLC